MSAPEFVPRPFEIEDWDRTIARFGDVSLSQSGGWGAMRAAAGWRVERGPIRQDGDEIGAAQVLLRDLPVIGGGLAWIGRGPLWRAAGGADDEAGDAGRLTAILDALRRHYADRGGYYLRVAPPIAADSAACAAFAAAGFRSTDTGGWASAALDLDRPVEALRAGLAQKWRNGLNKAEGLGIAVTQGADDADVDGFIAEYRAFLAARGFATTVTPDLLASLQRHLPPGRKLCAYRARHDGVPLGSVLIARYGRTAEYLAGTLLDAGRSFNVGQLLLWRAIGDARAQGLARFDVGGMDPALTPKGIYDFKNGMGGHVYRYANEIEADGGGVRARIVRWRVTRARAGLAAGAAA